MENIIAVLDAEFFKSVVLGTYKGINKSDLNPVYYQQFIQKMKSAAKKGLIRYSQTGNGPEFSSAGVTYQFRKANENGTSGSHFFSIITEYGQIISLLGSDMTEQVTVVMQDNLKSLYDQQQGLQMQSQMMIAQHDTMTNIIRSMAN